MLKYRRSALVCLLLPIALDAQGPAQRTEPATAPVILPQGGINRPQASDFQGSVATKNADTRQSRCHFRTRSIGD